MDKESEDDELDREIVYYYSRERRLAKAPRIVREMYENSGRPGRLNRVVGNRANIFLLLSIFMVFTMLVLSSRTQAPSPFKLGENTVRLSMAKNEGGVLVLTLNKTLPKKGVFYTGPVNIAVSPAQKKPPEGSVNPPPAIVAERFFFTALEEENFYLRLPFDGDEFFVFFEAEEERILKRIRPKK